jgi:hypothetical protein
MACLLHVSIWRIASAYRDASIRSLLEAQRTFREALLRIGATQVTHLCHSTINFAVMHSSVFTQRCGNVQLPA